MREPIYALTPPDATNDFQRRAKAGANKMLYIDRKGKETRSMLNRLRVGLRKEAGSKMLTYRESGGGF
jgi:hypothetical protein